jgi:succinate dehydrogenase / fumarate reductase cytochrome b subunit
MRFIKSGVGRKMFMAFSGFFMLFFVAVHLIGNSTIFFGRDSLNAYAGALHRLGGLVWIFRGFMVLMLAVHVWFGIALTLENSASKPSKYAVGRKLKAGFSGRTMIWTGLLILSFLVYHLLQFTFRVTPDIPPEAAAVRPGDVYSMVLASLKTVPIAVAYLAALATLFFHVSHGTQSFLQTLGLSNDRTLPAYETAGKVAGALLLAGFGAIPALILAGVLAR